MIKHLVLFSLLVTGVTEARPAPTFRGDLLGGGSLSLKEALKPNRSLLVCFWASWCVPCMKELRMVKESLAADSTLPLDILTVNEDTSDTSADVKPTLKLNHLEFPVILDPKQEIFARFHRENALPYSVLIRPNGDIAAAFDGLHEDEMVPTIKSLIQPKEPNAGT